MRWLKHLSSAHDDERLREVWTQYGLEAYGFWWVLCEIISENMDETDRCEISYPMRTWSSKFQLSKRKTGEYFRVFSEISLVFLEYDNSNCVEKIKISIPNLLKYRDEYSKRIGIKSGATPDKLPSKIEIEIEIENKKEEKNKEEKNKIKRFVPPSIEEVQEYMRKIDFNGDAQKWVDHYTSNGWHVGKNKMVDWKAAVRTWRGNNNGKSPQDGQNKADQVRANNQRVVREFCGE